MVEVDAVKKWWGVGRGGRSHKNGGGLVEVDAVKNGGGLVEVDGVKKNGGCWSRWTKSKKMGFGHGGRGGGTTAPSRTHKVPY